MEEKEGNDTVRNTRESNFVVRKKKDDKVLLICLNRGKQMPLLMKERMGKKDELPSGMFDD